MSTLTILLSAAGIVAFVAAIWLALAFTQAASTTYYCACPSVPGVPCWNKVTGPGGLCSYCVQGNHSGHMGGSEA